MDRLELFRPRLWQMSPGDRAALEGVVSSLAPRLALEIGSADGGSLDRIACHSEVVHSIDLRPPPTVPPNAVIHTGDSHQLLGALLADLDGNLDFAHIDGDHMTPGATEDLLTLLRADAVKRTVILVHDSLHETVRAAVRTAAEHPKVSFCDLDFVPGRMIEGGRFADELWGGFALILVGYERPEVEICTELIQWYDSYRSFEPAAAQVSGRRRSLRPFRRRA